MKRYLLVNTHTGVAEGIKDYTILADCLFDSLDAVLEYVYDNELNPLHYVVLEVTTSYSLDLSLVEEK